MQNMDLKIFSKPISELRHMKRTLVYKVAVVVIGLEKQQQPIFAKELIC